MTETIMTSDGRTLAFCEWGDPDGVPVFSLHGTPGSRLSRHPDRVERAENGRQTESPGRYGALGDPLSSERPTYDLAQVRARRGLNEIDRFGSSRDLGPRVTQPLIDKAERVRRVVERRAIARNDVADARGGKPLPSTTSASLLGVVGLGSCAATIATTISVELAAANTATRVDHLISVV